jgi:drug/metabolite transporter (DMT)-like permease
LSWRLAVGAVLAFVGVTLLAGVGSTLVAGDDHGLGIVLGLMAGFAYALFLLGLRDAATALPDSGTFAAIAVNLAWALLLAAAALALVGTMDGTLRAPATLPAWIALGVLGTFVQVGGWVLISTALPHVSVAHAGVTLLLQPALSTVWGALFFAEHFTGLQLIGALVAFVGVFAGSLRRAV